MTYVSAHQHLFQKEHHFHSIQTEESRLRCAHAGLRAIAAGIAAGVFHLQYSLQHGPQTATAITAPSFTKAGEIRITPL